MALVGCSNLAPMVTKAVYFVLMLWWWWRNSDEVYGEVLLKTLFGSWIGRVNYFRRGDKGIVNHRLRCVRKHRAI